MASNQMIDYTAYGNICESINRRTMERLRDMERREARKLKAALHDTWKDEDSIRD